jgi:DNA-binding NarL/FixJ family response regulator
LKKTALCYNASMPNNPAETANVDEPKRETTILIVDDHPLVRQALVNLLGSQHDFKVVGEASDGEEAIHLANQLKPDVVIMDITMPRINGESRVLACKMPDVEKLKKRDLSLFEYTRDELITHHSRYSAEYYLERRRSS